MRWQLVRRIVPGCAAVLIAGCGGLRLGPIMPTGTQPATRQEVEAFLAPFRPAEYSLQRFRWQFRDDRGAAQGRGSVRIAAPDTLRFDVAAALGSHRSAAFVVGDSAQWAVPEEDIEKLVPNYPLLWAMLGVPRLPGTGASVRRFGDDRTTAWQFVTGGDTVEYVLREGSKRELIADVREGSRHVGRVTTELGPDGRPISARLIVPSVPARLDITFYLYQTEAGFAPDIWVPEP